MIKITKQSGMTGNTSTMEIDCTQEQLDAGMAARAQGALIQDAFPMLNADEREFILTGITPAEWNSAFGEE